MLAFIALIATDSTAVKTIQKNADTFNKIDPMGVGMTVIGMSVVFASLLLLYLLFYNISKYLLYRVKKSKKIEGKPEAEHIDIEVSEEVNAAIATALHLYLQDMHDIQNTVLTINKVSRTYSPWSSKIYGLRQFPRN